MNTPPLHRHQRRRMEILSLLREGLTINEIAQHCGILPKVVKWHQSKINERTNNP